MGAKEAQVTSEVLKAIEFGSGKLNKLATGLSKRIEQFETWFSKLPGKVDTIYSIDDPDGTPNSELGFRVHRFGKRWILSHGYGQYGIWEGTTWTPVAEASLETKLLAVSIIPQLLANVLNAQEHLARRLEQAHAEFDSFARLMGIDQTEDK